MPRIVFFITQQYDPADPVLATTIPQVHALAALADEVVVVADRVDRSALPPNARAYSFHSRFKALRGLKLLAALVRELTKLRRDGVVITHMCPVYTIISAPLVRLAGVPLVMWHTHWKADLVVKTGERVASRVVSVDRSSFPFPSSRKLVATGHGIDVSSFSPRQMPFASQPLRVLVVTRYSPAKGHETVVRAVGIAAAEGVDVQLDVYGPALNDEARTFRARVERLVEELGLGDRVRLHDAVARDDLPALFETADLFVNNARGGADRVVFEAGASGLPIVASNHAHDDVLDDAAFFEFDQPESLARLFADAASRTTDESAAIGERLRERVLSRHSVDTWATGLLRAGGR